MVTSSGYQPPKVDYKKKRKSVTIPDQSMSIQEIVRRYVRGLPVDVIQKEPVYSEQSEHDLEKLSRLDFGEKAEIAAAMRLDAERLQAELQEAQRSANEAKATDEAKKAEIAQQALEEAAEKAAQRRRGREQSDRA